VSAESSVIARHVETTLDPVDLNGAQWQDAEPVTIKYVWTGELAPPERQAEVRMLWSDTGLHVRFVCRQSEPLVVSSTPNTQKKTLGLWNRDVCEIFIAPDADNPRVYYEFEAAPTGEWVDLAIVLTDSGRNTEWDYASRMQVATAIEPDRLLVAMLIPWSDRLPKPDVGTAWKTNLFRCVGSDESNRYLAWRPTRTPEPAFHVPEAFGWLLFK